jgi:hypothetical protein
MSVIVLVIVLMLVLKLMRMIMSLELIMIMNVVVSVYRYLCLEILLRCTLPDLRTGFGPIEAIGQLQTLAELSSTLHRVVGSPLEMSCDGSDSEPKDNRHVCDPPRIDQDLFNAYVMVTRKEFTHLFVFSSHMHRAMAVRMSVTMTVTVTVIVPMSVTVPMMMMPASRPHSEEIDSKADTGHEKKLICFHFWRVKSDLSVPITFGSTHTRCIASNMMKIEMRIRKHPASEYISSLEPVKTIDLG